VCPTLKAQNTEKRRLRDGLTVGQRFPKVAVGSLFLGRAS